MAPGAGVTSKKCSLAIIEKWPGGLASSVGVIGESYAAYLSASQQQQHNAGMALAAAN